jgi:putative acetyltransferase
MSIKIIPYTEDLNLTFKNLNIGWLERYNLLEPHDVEVLDHPKEMIIDTGGAIFFAENDGEIIGSSALMKIDDGVFELVKMAVKDSWQGQGISKLLLSACLEEAKRLKAVKLVLFSNSQLRAALGLYEKYGFKYVPVADSPFVTADIKMEMDLMDA